MKGPSPLADFGSDPVRQLLLPALVAIPLAAALGFGGVHYLAAVVIGGIGAGLFIASPRAFILVFLATISLRNFVAGGERLGGELLNFDLGGLANVLASFMGIVYFLVLWKNPFKGRSLTLPYGAFLAIFALSVLWAPDLRWALRFVTRLAAPFFTYLIISDLLDRKMVKQVTYAIYASSVIPILYGFFQLITDQGNLVTEGYVRINSSFFHPAHFSMYLTFLFCLAYAEFLDPRTGQKVPRVIYICALVVLEIATYTRISWLAMLLCWIYLSWVYNKRSYLLAGAVVGMFVLAVFGGPIIERVTSASSDLGSSGGGEEAVYDLNSSVGWRLYFWDEILRRFWDRLWIGFGAGSSVMLGVELFGIEAAPHNGYLRVLYETGLAGTAAFVWVLGTMFWQGFRLIRRRVDTRVSHVSHIYVTMTLTYVLLNLTDNILEYYEVAIYQWAILSLVEYNNLLATRVGLIERSGLEEDREVEDEAVEELKETVEEIEEEATATPGPPGRPATPPPRRA